MGAVLVTGHGWAFAQAGHGEDPLSREGTEGLEQVRIPAPTPPRVKQGARLKAYPGVRETKHRVEIAFRGAAPEVTETITFENRTDFAGEVEYRIDTEEPIGAVRAAVCEPVCKPDAATTAAWDEAAGVIVLRTAGVAARASREVRVVYALPVEVLDGHGSLAFPARASDGDGVPLEVTATASGAWRGADADDDPESPEADGQVTVPVHGSFRVGAKLVRAIAQQMPGANGAALRRSRAAPAGPRAPIALTLWVDASRSMEGPARSRVLRVVEALRASLPAGSVARALAFGSTAEWLGGAEFVAAAQLPMAAIGDRIVRPLGSATKVESAWALISEAKERPPAGLRERWVLVGDGTLTTSRAATRALAAMERRRVPWFVVNLLAAGALTASDGGSATAAAVLTDAVIVRAAHGSGGLLLKPGARADENAKAADVAALRRLLAAVSARPVGQFAGRTLRAGLGVVTETGRAGAGRSSKARAAPDALGAGVPAETVLEMLRTRVVPAARLCLRSDRKGRGNYSARAAYEFVLRNREIAEGRVTGAIPTALKACLEGTLDALEIPAFAGTIAVRYPIYTATDEAEPPIELSSDALRAVEEVAGDAPSIPPRTPDPHAHPP